MVITEIGESIDKAVTLLNANEVVAIPTETVYGLAANALSNEAVIKIFEAKNRPFFNPLILHVSSVDEIYKYAEIDGLSLQLANHFMPGPFTILLPKKSIVPELVTAGSERVAIRIPNHAIAKELLSKLKFPLAAPSANAFGYVSPVNAEHVKQGLEGKISYILDGGNCTVGLESTIVEVVNDEIVLHRVGGMSIEEIENVAGKKIVVKKQETVPETSGQLKSHYATTTPLYQGNIAELIKLHSNKKVAILTFSKSYSELARKDQFQLSISGQMNEAAQNLFSTMRKMDRMNYDIILAEIFPSEGLGRAINDRLQRAQETMK